MKSMTGYAHVERDLPRFRAALEIKSWNNRFLDIYVQLPQAFSALEPFFRDRIGAAVQRGKVECSLKVKDSRIATEIRVDETMARAGVSAIDAIARVSGALREVFLPSLLSFEGVISCERDLDLDEAERDLEAPLGELLAAFNARRATEGANLAVDMRSQAGCLREGLARINDALPRLESWLRDSLKRKLDDIRAQELDENRMAQEIALSLTRYTINEEIVRLGSHLEALDVLLSADRPTGKSFDFLCQEIQREVNTIGSKNQLTEICPVVIEMKEAVENIREQARNVE